MAHRLLVPPVRRMEGIARLPRVQLIDESIARNFQDGLIPQDSLRRIKTAQTIKATGPLSSPQVFAISRVNGPNDPESMRAGLKLRNAPLIANKNRGRSAGV